MTLVGHSLGAYMSVAYALKYPTRVSKLVLLSPAGVPRDPNTTVPSREITDDQTNEPGYVSVDDAHLATKAEVDEIKSEQRNQGRRQGRLWQVLTYLWEEGWSPFQIVRSAMWYGPILVGKYSSRRFSGLAEEEVREMHDYILNITLAKGSGEYCICASFLFSLLEMFISLTTLYVAHIFAPGAHARMPLVDRVAELKVPITFSCKFPPPFRGCLTPSISPSALSRRRFRLDGPRRWRQSHREPHGRGKYQIEIVHRKTRRPPS